MLIRKVTSKDYQTIYQLVKTAFLTAKVSDGTEQDYVETLRKSPNYLPELEFVAVNDDELIGHIMLTKLEINDQENKIPTLLLAPLCVALPYRSRGIGKKLIEYSKQAAIDAGYRSIVLVGDLNYYGRFGFKTIDHFNIKNIANISNEHLLILELYPDALKEVQGTIKVI